MAITFELWQLITLASMLLSAFSALAWALLSRIERGIERSLGNVSADMDARFKALRQDSEKWSQLERDFLKHLADLPVHYVRREDYVRGQTVIEAKLDAIAAELKMVQIEGGKS